MPVAGAPDVLAAPDDFVPDDAGLDEDDAPVTLDDEPEPPCKAFWMPCKSWELTRCKAVPLAMLASPFPKLVSADCMALITVSVAAIVASGVCAWPQKAWSCCQNDGVLPILPTLMTCRRKRIIRRY